MALDGIILSKLKEQLDKLLPIRINRISGNTKTELVFNIHANNQRTNLLMSFHSNYNHLTLSNKNFQSFDEPNSFVMVLRKYLLNGIIYQIDQFEYDRYLLMHIKALNDLYDEKRYLLSVELMGKYANLILIDEDNMRIIDALKKIPPFENNKRTILQNALFIYPEKQNKIDPFEACDYQLEESFVKQFQGFSKTLENEVRKLLNEYSFKEIMAIIKKADKLYITDNEDNYEYHIIPLTHLNKSFKEYSIFEGFDELYSSIIEKERIKTVTSDIYKFVKKEIKHYESKIAKLHKSLEDAMNLEKDQEYADLLFTYSNLNEKGLKEITIKDYEDNDVLIKLDPKLSIKDNANKYYQSYHKKRKGQTFINEQIAIANNELTYFNALNEQLTMANYLDALDIKDELFKNGYLRKDQSKVKKKKKINLYQVKINDHTITFGKNNLQNDYLTFTYAHSNYTWFHANKYHGAHVVIDTDNPNEEEIRLAANIAGFYSNGRMSSSLPVDYTLIRNIKKIKGMPSGFVSIRNQKTIYIDPEAITLEIVSI